MTSYPKRDAFFAHKAFRIMHKASVAAVIGRDAFCLVAVILHTEDAARYRGPVRFWNSQLIETLGFSKWDTFDKARRRAIDSGWLQYSGDGKRSAGEYFVTIPPEYEQVDDSPVEECSSVNYELGYKAGYEAGIIEGMKRGQSVVRTGDDVGEPYNPIPNPSPKKTKAFAKPSVSELQAYIDQIGSTVDAGKFRDYYDSVGWTIGKGKPMKDWRAAVRTWEAKAQSEKPKRKDPMGFMNELLAKKRRGEITEDEFQNIVFQEMNRRD